jgi:LysM repeat protein
MCSACDDESETAASAPATDHAAGLTRRGLFLGGIGLALAACVRGGGAPKPGVGKGVWYTVPAGDSLTAISRRTGITTDRLASINALKQPNLIPGTRLWIPDVTVVPPPEKPAYVPPKAQPKPNAPLADDEHYEIVPRSAWTNEPIGPNHVLMGKVNKITIHHTDEHAGMAERNDLEVVRMIERFHRGPQKRWAAIGYHYLIGKDGKIYEGRPVKFQGAHCGKNENNLGISVIGDCHHNLPNPKQLRALKAFLEDQRARFNVPRDQVFGHRDLKPTICPGDRLYGWVVDYAGRSK